MNAFKQQSDNLATRVAIPIRIELTFDGVDTFDQLAWLEITSLLLEACARPGEILVRADALHPKVLRAVDEEIAYSSVRISSDTVVADDTTEVVYLSASARLTRKLLRRFSCFHIMPSNSPLEIDPDLYWRLEAGIARLDRLKRVVAMIGDEVMQQRFDAFRSAIKPARPRAALLSSIFDGDRFLASFLENTAGLEAYDACEHFLVRAASPGDEHGELFEHARRFPAAVYVNLPHDPGLYEVWNMAARLTVAPYLSSANIDDRRAPEHVAKLVERLDADASVGVASSALRVTDCENTPWSECENLPVWYSDGFGERYAAADLLKQAGSEFVSRNIPHCMPLWRRSLHAFHGYFREREFGPSADWEFWLRVGSAGVRFGHLPEPLGLYLRRPDSYWRTGSSSSSFDQRIVDQYAPVLHRNASGRKGKGKGRGGQAKTPVALWFGELRALSAVGADLEFASRFLTGAARLLKNSLSETARMTINAYGRRFFGVQDIAAWFVNNPRNSAGKARNLAGVLTCMADILHLWQENGNRGLPRRLPIQLIQNALTDIHSLSGDVRALIACALAWRRMGKGNAEARMLRTAHDEDAEQFWRGFQDIYRFEMPLKEITRIVRPDISIFTARSAGKMADMNLWFYPDFSQANAYQDLLYQGVRRAGGKVKGLARLDQLGEIKPVPDSTNVLHLHWIHPILKGTGRIAVQKQVDDFLERIDTLREQGVQVYWTVHNFLSHEGEWPEIEWKFRQRLAASVDRLYIHHPMIPAQLEWLPEGPSLHLVEHGSYPVPAETVAGRDAFRESMGFAPDDLVLMYFGSVKDYKGLDKALPTIRDVMERDRRIKLLVAGKVVSKAARRELRKLPGDKVVMVNRFVPEQELVQLLRTADYAFLSYRSIITSGSLFQAFSAGVPVIAPHLGTIPAYVVDGWNGYLYKSAEGLRRMLVLRMKDSPAFISELRKNAAETAERLSWQFDPIGEHRPN